jgi:hypothetical protein
MHGPVKVPLSRVFRDRAEECRTMGELFRSEKTREHLLKVAADYENMSITRQCLNCKMPIGKLAWVALVLEASIGSPSSRWRFRL